MMSSLISSTMLRSSPLTHATSLSSGALSSMHAFSLTPTAAAASILASSSTHSSLSLAAASSATSSSTTASFISPFYSSALMPPRSSSSSSAGAVISSSPRMVHPRPAFVVSPLPASFMEEPIPDVNNPTPSKPLPNVIPTDSDFVPSTKSLRHKLHIPEQGPLPPRAVLPRVVGHRGALYDELENTLSGFARCAELGCDAVELDVFVLKDDTLVVFHGGGSDEHPGDLIDYCGIPGNILDMTFEETQQLAFNPNFDEFPCPTDKIQSGRIPTLEQVLLKLKPTNTHVKIELKGPGVVKPVLELVERLGMVEQCEFSSFDHDRLKQLRELRPQVDDHGRYIYKTGALFDDIPEDFIAQAKAVGASEVHLRYDHCTVDRVKAIHEAGMDSMAWFRGPVGMKSDVTNKYWDIGNEDERCYQTLIDSGVSQLCVNRPDVLIHMLKRQHHHVDLAASPIMTPETDNLDFITPPRPIPLIVDDE